MIKLAILGCTGSIGTQTLDVVRANPDKLSVTALSCGSNADKLIELAREFDCKTVGIADASRYGEIKRELTKANVYCGDDALTALAVCDADIIVVAVVGMIGLKAVLAAIGAKKIVALANKESLVAGGDIVLSALKAGGELRPIDSEHSAVWQCMRGEKKIKRVILTASGGPFYFSTEDLSVVTPERAVAHPTWRMGRKISVDSATMMNKALEIIEARWLFGTTDIDYVIHPQSVVHSMVEFDDGSIKAQASYADMRLPIQYAILGEHYPRDFTPLSLPLKLEFFPPDEKRFPAPSLARRAIKTGGNAAVVMNAANEAAVRLFLERKILFTDIVKTVECAMDKFASDKPLSEAEVFETHNAVYEKIYCMER